MPSAGWFSERSGAYLASGRPVLMEETGISQHMPTGEGLLIFSSIDEAAARVHEVMDRYADQDVGFVDAAVLSIVERLRETKLATLDRRHFSVLRPRHVDALDLLPD